MIEKFDSDELDTWRHHPVTDAFRRTLRAKLKGRELDLYHAGIDGSLDRIRLLSGAIKALKEVEDMIETEGEEEA